MASWKLVTFLAVAVSCTSALEVRHVRSSRVSAASTTELPTAPFSIALTDKAPRSSYKKQLLRELRSGGKSKTAVVDGSGDDEEYLTDIVVGGQSFKVIVDTGSSDTWLADKGFKCFTLDNSPQPAADCFFGTTGFDTSKSKTFVPLPDTNFNISYGDGEFLTGSVGFDTVTVGGLTVTRQEIGVVTAAAWEGDSINTGLMGLAFPDLTSVYNGSNPDLDGADNSLPYNPFFFSAVQQKVVSTPVFSVALNREFFYYAVDIDALVFPGSTAKTTIKAPTIIDTGTTLNYVPTNIAKAFNARFDPPATFVEDEDTYYVDCNATAPAFSAKIGGVEFAVDGRDQILPFLDENNDLVCISGTQDGGPDEDDTIFIFGDVFLHNVVATFDISKNDIILTERASY
ncbi:hypothetical protein EW026_g5877 [Hermanssonia centrifuga]|uniref:Peptidase A1 domain-containing protein n=1 Tax=Hermanssonia centrifuga TaxID=98765 RepID=A0A4S4KDR3_9APHY|nr:hypothetical protein EW026_g5877 [Hermanssonia centrifuga]